MNVMKVLMLGEGLDRQGGIVSVEKLILEEATSDVVFKHIATLPKGSSVYKVLVFFKAIVELFWRLLLKEADLVHIHVSERGSAFRQAITALIIIGFRIPVIMHTHSCDFHSFYSKLPQWIQQWMSWVFGSCTRFIVLSESWKTYYIENIGLKQKRVIVLPNPVKIPLQVPQRLGSQKVNIVFLGRIGQRKGAFDLIQAFASLPTEQKTCSRLTVAGDGEGEQARSLVKSLNLTDYITILDWVNQEQRDALLAKADVFVLPSYNEGLPMAVLEAMSWSLPVITTPVGGIPEVITHNQNGLLVTPGNIQDLSEAMQSLIKDEQMRLSLGNKARISVKHLDVRDYFGSLKNIYNSVLTVNNQQLVNTVK
ncbi:MAG TPA: glycosyltransferase family 1 protein [Cyanobacteria bacterium UBA8543]|nr:glycosyltransferase family 1 protein [Cyanobacteria bacterium UBA8543]